MKMIGNLFRFFSIINRRRLGKMAKNNRNINKLSNSYYDVEGEEKKAMIKAFKKKLWSNKFGISCIAISIITLIILIVFTLCYFNDQKIENLLIFILVLLITPGTSIIAAIGLKNSGPLMDIYTRANNFVTLEDDSLIYTFDVLDNSVNNTGIANRVSYKIKYSDITKITYNEDLKRYTIYGDFKEIHYLGYDENEAKSKDMYSDFNVKNSNFIFYDFFDKRDIFRNIEEKTNLKIESVPKKEITHKFNFIFILIFYLFLLLSMPIIFVFSILEQKEINNKDISVNINVTTEDKSIMYTEKDYEKIKEIITKDLGNKSHIIFYTSGEDIESNKYKEKYRYLNVLAYKDSSNDVYSYIFYKYITKSNLHDLSELELNGSFVLSTVTKKDLKIYEKR